jgi:hypothetical protein
MINSDAALGLAVFFFYLAMMLWGVFQTFWPSRTGNDLPGGGHRVRMWDVGKPVFETASSTSELERARRTKYKAFRPFILSH